MDQHGVGAAPSLAAGCSLGPCADRDKGRASWIKRRPRGASALRGGIGKLPRSRLNAQAGIPALEGAEEQASNRESDIETAIHCTRHGPLSALR
jgi:hypothetical protein